MLRLACSLSVRNGAGFLWVDRLCIIQTDTEDVRWNLQRMARAYRKCKQCLIFPGGLRRLASIHETTGYNERPWTLQEALLPARALVVFSSPSLKLSYLPIRFAYTTLRSGVYAVSCGLHDLLQRARANETIRLFGDATTASTAHLLDALNRKHGAMSWEEQYALYRSVWQSAMLRKYQDPQDLFLCTMEVLGVRLNGDRSSGAIVDAFLQAIQPQGLMDPRFVALARVVMASRDASPEWCSTYFQMLNSLTSEPSSSIYTPSHLFYLRLESGEMITALRLGTSLLVKDILPLPQLCGPQHSTDKAALEDLPR
ncbi:hypothetical protein EIP86_008197 [Pleurotus ostreatoroseus]|nr:hypothetical protein EIP86_008197 [Pleurotus ostreatoroseus]